MLPAARARVRIFCIAAAAVLLAGAGFAAGRLTAPDAEARTSQCAESRTLYREELDKINTDQQETADMRTSGRTLANTILQNPSCFSASERASAQTLLDTIDEGAQQDAINELRDDMEQCVEDATDDYSWSNC
jgi:hypothetical protein